MPSAGKTFSALGGRLLKLGRVRACQKQNLPLFHISRRFARRIVAVTTIVKISASADFGEL